MATIKYFFYNSNGKFDPDATKLSLLMDSTRGIDLPPLQVGEKLHVLNLFYEITSIQQEMNRSEVYYRVLLKQLSDNDKDIILDEEASEREPQWN